MTTYTRLKYKEPLHFQTWEVAIVGDVKNLVGIDAAGLLVPGADATATRAIGFAYKTNVGVGEMQTVGMGLIALENDPTTPVTPADIGTVGKVGADGSNITISPASGTRAEIGRIKAIDSEGKVWVDTEDRGA